METAWPTRQRYGEIYERELLIELVERRIEQDHREEIREIFRMLRQGYTLGRNRHAAP